jgi:hypothetical protein
MNLKQTNKESSSGSMNILTWNKTSREISRASTG